MLRRPVRHVIFDLDGLLLDTEPLYTQAIARVAARFGKVYDWSIEAECIGRGTMEAAATIVAALELPLSPAELIAARDPILVELLTTAAPLPGAEALTRSLAARPIPTAIATSTEASLFAIKAAPHRPWLSMFDAVVCGDDARVARPQARAGHLPGCRPAAGRGPCRHAGHRASSPSSRQMPGTLHLKA